MNALVVRVSALLVLLVGDAPAALGEPATARAILLNVGKGQVPSDTGQDDKTRPEIVEGVKELGGKALKVAFAPGDSFGGRVGGNKDWKRFTRFRFDAVNPDKAPVTLELTVIHGRSTSYPTRVVVPIMLKPGQNEVELGIEELRNVNGSAPDLANVVRWYLHDAGSKGPTLYFGDIRLEGGNEKARPGAAAAVHGDPARLARLRAAKMPKIDKPISFDTPEADAILSALEVFPPDNPWNLVVADWPLHPNSKNIIASIGANKPLRYNPDMGFVLVPPDQKKSRRQDRRLPRRVGQGAVPGAGQHAHRGLAGPLSAGRPQGDAGRRAARQAQGRRRPARPRRRSDQPDAVRVLPAQQDRHRLAGGAGVHLRSEVEQAAAGRLDLDRRRRPADLPRRGALRRAEARPGRARPARDGGEDAPGLRLPRARTTPAAAPTRTCRAWASASGCARTSTCPASRRRCRRS